MRPDCSGTQTKEQATIEQSRTILLLWSRGQNKDGVDRRAGFPALHDFARDPVFGDNNHHQIGEQHHSFQIKVLDKLDDNGTTTTYRKTSSCGPIQIVHDSHQSRQNEYSGARPTMSTDPSPLTLSSRFPSIPSVSCHS